MKAARLLLLLGLGLAAIEEAAAAGEEAEDEEEMVCEGEGCNEEEDEVALMDELAAQEEEQLDTSSQFGALVEVPVKEDLATLIAIWDLLNTNKDDKLDFEELYKGVETVKLDCPSVLKYGWPLYDLNRDGKLTWSEAFTAMDLSIFKDPADMDMQSSAYGFYEDWDEEYEAARFQAADANKNGFLEKSEYCLWNQSYATDIRKLTAKQEIKMNDLNNDGLLQFTEWWANFSYNGRGESDGRKYWPLLDLNKDNVVDETEMFRWVGGTREYEWGQDKREYFPGPLSVLQLEDDTSILRVNYWECEKRNPLYFEKWDWFFPWAPVSSLNAVDVLKPLLDTPEGKNKKKEAWIQLKDYQSFIEDNKAKVRVGRVELVKEAHAELAREEEARANYVPTPEEKAAEEAEQARLDNISKNLQAELDKLEQERLDEDKKRKKTGSFY